MLSVLVALRAVGGIRYYVKIVRLKQQAEGDAEFEDVCITFNHMQEHILREQEKNRKYEKARTDMIAGISHDLRTPLTAIRGTIKGLMDGIAATPEMQEKFCRLHTVGPEIWTDF